MNPDQARQKRRAWPRSMLFDTLRIFLKEFFKTVDFEKSQQTTKIMKNYPACTELNNRKSFEITIPRIFLCYIVADHLTNDLNQYSMFCFQKAFLRNKVDHITYGPRREKTCLRRFANNTGTDQPAHLRSLISAFVIRFLESIISRLATSEIQFSS